MSEQLAHHDPTRARLLIAERGTDWLRALRGLSLAHQPFVTLVQADHEHDFLRERPWLEAPRELVLLWGSDLGACVLEARLALLRHLIAEPRPISVRVVADSDEAAIANEAFLEVVRALAPELRIETTSLGALSTRALAASAPPVRRAA